jgi:hypothetical protein
VLTHAPLLIIHIPLERKRDVPNVSWSIQLAKIVFRPSTHKEDEQAGRIIKQVPKYVCPGNLSLFWVRQKKSAAHVKCKLCWSNDAAAADDGPRDAASISPSDETGAKENCITSLRACRFVILPFACGRKTFAPWVMRLIAAAHLSPLPTKQAARYISGVYLSLSLSGRALFNCARSSS